MEGPEKGGLFGGEESDARKWTYGEMRKRTQKRGERGMRGN